MAGAEHVDVELRIGGIDGQEFVGALVVEPGDRLVLNLGPGASDRQVGAAKDHLREHDPELADRTLFVRIEGMAVVRAEQDQQPAGET